MSGGTSNYAHLVRMAGLFVLGILLFLGGRSFFVPKDFGVYGHYRAGALDDARARPIKFAGQATCVECHANIGDLRKTTRHAKVSCESCHGPLASHAALTRMPETPNAPRRPLRISSAKTRSRSPPRTTALATRLSNRNTS